jgi:hypothetical protein
LTVIEYFFSFTSALLNDIGKGKMKDEIFNLKCSTYQKKIIVSRTRKLKKKTRLSTSEVYMQALKLYLQSLNNPIGTN